MKLLTGNTYPVRDKIKALGGIWNPVQKGWMIPADKFDEAAALVKYAPPADRVKRPRFSHRYVTASARFGRCSCEDYPCCGH